MKLRHVILAGLAGLVLSSCELSGNSEATPQIMIAAINTTQQDTLGFYGNRLDSVYVGDTILFQTNVFGQYNALLEYNIKSSDTAYVEFLWGDEHKLDSVFTSYENGRFKLNGTANILYFPFKYIIKKPKDDLELTFSALTDASPDYNSRSLTIITPVKAQKAEEGTDKEDETEGATE